MTEAQSYSLEARRAEELAQRLETQASWYSSENAAGSLNLTQAFREWGIGEMDANRDYYGATRFDDVAFQLSAKGQELQARFVGSYADRLHHEIDDKLALPSFDSVARTKVRGPGDVRASGAAAASSGSTQSDLPERVEAIGAEVHGKQDRGGRRLGKVHDELESRTRDAHGASAEAADDVKEW